MSNEAWGVTPSQVAEALAQLGYVLERAESPTDIRTWPDDEAEAYREFRFQEGRDAAHAVRVKRLAAVLSGPINKEKP